MCMPSAVRVAAYLGETNAGSSTLIWPVLTRAARFNGHSSLVPAIGTLLWTFRGRFRKCLLGQEQHGGNLGAPPRGNSQDAYLAKFSVMTNVIGDFNQDSLLTVEDLDLLASAMQGGDHNSQFGPH